MSWVTVIYKNGVKVHIKCKAFSVERTAGKTSTSVTWESAWPRPLLIGVHEIMAIYEGKV